MASTNCVDGHWCPVDRVSRTTVPIHGVPTSMPWCHALGVMDMCRVSSTCIGCPGHVMVIYPDFPLDMTGLFPGEDLILILANKMQDF